jgi:hypothetical protein
VRDSDKGRCKTESWPLAFSHLRDLRDGGDVDEAEDECVSLRESVVVERRERRERESVAREHSEREPTYCTTL